MKFTFMRMTLFELRVLLEDGELAFVANSIEVKRQNRFANIFA